MSREPALQIDFQLVVLLVIVAVRDKAQVSCGGDVGGEVIDEEGLCGIEPQAFNRVVKNGLSGFRALGGVGVDAVIEVSKHGVAGEQVLFVETTGVGEQVERQATSECLQGGEDGGIGGEDVAPNRDELGGAALEIDGSHALSDEVGIGKLTILERLLEGLQEAEYVGLGVRTKGGETFGGDAEVKSDQHIADIA